MRRNRWLCIAVAASFCMLLFAGCTNEKKENQAAYRQIGINAMESGDYTTAVESFNSALGECVGKITPDELYCLGRRFCMLKNNRFLQYGYYNFGHLLLCRNSRGQYILGVPGGYDQQERFMAGMFGFPYFKESSQISLPGRKGGYWYRSVDSPNLH